MKKFISMMMALAMTFALAIPAFAASITISGSGLAASGQYQFNMGAAVQTPIINVYVPQANADNDKVVLNPYGLEFRFDTSNGSTETPKKDQVISTPIWLGSLSNVPLKVGMTVKAATAGNAALSTKSLADDTKTTTNSVFIWGQALPAGASQNIPATLPGFASAYNDTEGKSGSMILVKAGETGSSRTGICTIPASAGTTNATDNQWACVKFFGDAVKAPTIPWDDGDTVTLNITFTFTPSMGE